jgi:hypothetical protein
MSIMVTAMASQHNTAQAESNRLPTFNDYPDAKTDCLHNAKTETLM